MGNKPWPLLNYGFRCFFLLAGIWAVLAMALWLWVLRGGTWLGPDPLLWHGHEMLIGFVGAAIAGFLLTAAPAWTNQPPPQGVPLGVLALTWLLGRTAMALGGVLPALWVLLLDVLFPVLLVGLVAWMLLRAGNRRNYPLAVLLGLFPLADVLIHLDSMGVLAGGRQALNGLPHLAALLVTIVGGRITPSFTTNWLRMRGMSASLQNWPWLEKIIVPATLLAAVLLVSAPQFWLSALVALLVAALHALRLFGWRGWRTLAEPLLAVLHLGYGWIAIGYALLGLASLGWLNQGAALHALTAGALGMMILAVMTRVALGHTGRPLHAPRTIVAAYTAVGLAALLRVLAPVFADFYSGLLLASGLAWIIAFGLFLWVYWPILTRPRSDGKPERIASRPKVEDCPGKQSLASL